MKNMVKLILVLVVLCLVSCAGMEDLLNTTLGSGGLTSEEVSLGLKEALHIGARFSVDNLSAVDGFFKDQMVKILLPPETEKVVKLITRIPGGKKLVNDVVLLINRGAEDAVKGAGSIFFNAIKSLTIQDAFNILRGGEHAATEFLKAKTFESLYSLFKPVISNSLDKKLIGNLSANQTWDLFTGKYNQAAKSIAGQVAGLKPLHLELNEYVTHKSLDALFYKISVEEKKIRDHPFARTTHLLKRVFGSLDK